MSELIIFTVFLSTGTLFHTSSKNGAGLPSNMEELDAQDRMGFSANRYKDISFGVVQSQTSSMFGGSFMSDQSSQGKNDQF
jgi:hypothetical protein